MKKSPFQEILSGEEVVVPDSFDPVSWSEHAKEVYNAECPKGDKLIGDIPLSSHLLRAGDRFGVRTYEYQYTGVGEHIDPMCFLTERRAAFIGVYGTTLVLDQILEALDPGYLYLSYDCSEYLPVLTGGDHGVPFFYINPGGVLTSKFDFFGLSLPLVGRIAILHFTPILLK